MIVKSVFSWLKCLFIKEPKMVERHVWDSNSGCERLFLVPKGTIVPGMRIEDVANMLIEKRRFRDAAKLLDAYIPSKK